MSYILDALRKADAQRARDPARGIHAQPAAAVATADTARPGRLYWAVAAVTALVVIACGWLWFAPTPAPPVVAQAPAPATVVRSDPAPVATVAPPATEVLPPPPEPAPPPPPVVARAAPAKALPAASAPVAPPTAPPAASTQPTAPAAERTYSLAELPPDVQQALPKFNVTGGVYSENVAQRMLIVNGQVFNEGSEIAAGVVVEQIRPRVALLKFRGVRISQPY